MSLCGSSSSMTEDLRREERGSQPAIVRRLDTHHFGIAVPEGCKIVETVACSTQCNSTSWRNPLRTRPKPGSDRTETSCFRSLSDLDSLRTFNDV